MREYIWVLALPAVFMIIFGALTNIIEIKIVFIVFGIFMLIETIFVSLFLKRFSTAEFVINDNGVNFKNNKKDISFKYDEIEKLSTASVSNLGGFITIVGKNGKKIKLTVVIENIGDLILTLKKRVNELELDIYDNKKLFSFYKTSVYSDTSWRRLYYAFPEILIYSLFGTVIIFISGLLFSEVALNAFVPIIIVATIIYLIIELAYYGRKLKKSTNPETWEIESFDLDKEKRVIKYLIRIPSAVIVLAFIVDIILGVTN